MQRVILIISLVIVVYGCQEQRLTKEQKIMANKLTSNGTTLPSYSTMNEVINEAVSSPTTCAAELRSADITEPADPSPSPAPALITSSEPSVDIPENAKVNPVVDQNAQSVVGASNEGVIKMLTNYFPPGSGNFNMSTLGGRDGIAGINLFCETANAILEGRTHPAMSEFPQANTHCETAVYLSTLKILKAKGKEIDASKYGCRGKRNSFGMPSMFRKLQDRNELGFEEAFVATGLIPGDKTMKTSPSALNQAFTEGKPKAGDPLYISRTSGKGHSVIFSHFEQIGNSVKKICYWSSNQSGNIGNNRSGYGERCETIQGEHSSYRFFSMDT